jgi:NAD+ kinase
MDKRIDSVLLIVNKGKRESPAMVDTIRNYLEERHIEVTVIGFDDNPAALDSRDFDLAFSLGGDGTVLYSARILADRNLPILAVNMGDFGFITEIGKDEWKSAFEKYQDDLLGISKRIMLTVAVFRNNIQVAKYTGLNDSVVSSSGISKIVKLEVALSNTRLGEYRADGVIVSTPTGSTAYSAAAGGPILDPEMDAMIINPICPFTLSNRTLVIPGSETVSVEVLEEQRTGVTLTVDGQHSFNLKPGDVVRFSRSPQNTLLVRSDKRNFYEVLRSKLRWSGGPNA